MVSWHLISEVLLKFSIEPVSRLAATWILLFGLVDVAAHAQVPGLAGSKNSSAASPSGSKGGGGGSGGGSGSGGDSGGGSPSPSGGGGGNLALESQTISYEAINQLAGEIANRSKTAMPCGDTKPIPERPCEILLANAANVSALQSFLAFKAAGDALKDAYTQYAAPKKPNTRPNFPTGELVGPAATLFAPLVSGLLTALKGQTTQSSATFNPNDQALYADLEAAIHDNCANQDLLVTAYPAMMADAYKNEVGNRIQAIFDERDKAIEALKKAHENSGAKKPDTKPKDDANGKDAEGKKEEAPPPYDPLTAELKDIEAQFTDFQGIVTTPSSNSAILFGAALFNKLGDHYGFLTVTDDIAGGGSRANQYFLINLFVPAPHVSYNGGAVVSYSLRRQDGTYGAAGTLRFIYGYSKWSEPPLRGNKKSYSNFDDKENKKQHGRWVY